MVVGGAYEQIQKKDNYVQGKYSSDNVSRDPGSSKSKGIDVSWKGININSKTVGLNQLDVVSKKYGIW